MRTLLIMLIGFGALSTATAETLRLPPSDPTSKTLPLKGEGATAKAASCASYGRAFMWVESAKTCVKIGGSISVDTTIRR